MNFPETGEHIQGDGWVLVVTSTDLATGEVRAKLFQTQEEALNWRHEVSLKQFPEWHAESCSICNPKPKAVK